MTGHAQNNVSVSSIYNPSQINISSLVMPSHLRSDKLVGELAIVRCTEIPPSVLRILEKVLSIGAAIARPLGKH